MKGLCSMSKYHFLRMFAQITGSTPLEYRSNLRLAHAAELLREERLTVEEIMAQHRALYGPDRTDVAVPLPQGAKPAMPYWMK